ncbi:hypothetical protein CGC49_00450 [Capnocytophaga sp. H4358]|nr:hypothetical protein CGC49_00450 [Capnocytophaga sp. H4358]
MLKTILNWATKISLFCVTKKLILFFFTRGFFYKSLSTEQLNTSKVEIHLVTEILNILWNLEIMKT